MELALAEGTSISGIARQPWAPGRDSIRYHLDAGHLRGDLQQRAERALGLDYTTVVARVVEIAQRARTAALEAVEADDRAGVLRAGDAELRALGMLAASDETSEAEIQLRSAYRDVTAAVFRLARSDADTAERVAAELDNMHRPLLAEGVRDHATPKSRNEMES
ncbi:hypothetical protein [Microbacterium caowuchunii]|uniref:Uncharacterized protein n=1 Tax=Microbacterium caowuchunii TaxID=2614638 RepID=A0A5N0T8S7_9MICO|nr:hypothetical protein [Microbacterium caowuchunii]KAA9131161.1 hypothetical protein F6B40_12740 [Microbacterium caowuchunii]